MTIDRQKRRVGDVFRWMGRMPEVFIVLDVVDCHTTVNGHVQSRCTIVIDDGGKIAVFGVFRNHHHQELYL